MEATPTSNACPSHSSLKSQRPVGASHGAFVSIGAGLIQQFPTVLGSAVSRGVDIDVDVALLAPGFSPASCLLLFLLNWVAFTLSFRPTSAGFITSLSPRSIWCNLDLRLFGALGCR